VNWKETTGVVRKLLYYVRWAFNTTVRNTVVSNIEASAHKGLYVYFTIGSNNAHTFAESAEKILGIHGVKGILFHLYTPYIGGDHSLLLYDELREAVLERLIAFKRAHPVSTFNTFRGLRALAADDWERPTRYGRISDSYRRILHVLVTHLVRILLARQLGPYSFVRDVGYLPSFDLPNLGLYVHVPFCETLCPFCPYYKIKADKPREERFLRAILDEIWLVAERICAREKRRGVSSLYFGGGSPAVMISDLAHIRRRIDEHFDVTGNSGVELHPRDVDADTAGRLRDSGFDMVSLGVQSFSREIQENLGRAYVDGRKPLVLLRRGGFKVIDVDLIFAIPGQDASSLREDFLLAADLGASQVSTYPFIDFSYAKNKYPPLGHAGKKRMLESLLATAEEAGFERTSVWTFGRRSSPRYSSVTRDCFIGFGPSAASLGGESFKVNTFSVDSYAEAVSRGVIPTALRMSFSPRTRRLYWMFWSCYNGMLSERDYGMLFHSDLADDFGFPLSVAESLGLLERATGGWTLTRKGSYFFHRVEQQYTRQYIDKTWRSSMETPWPEKIVLL
jgi:coproporphyrinogen III oxidase-like Fe-S oxidoreductase